MRRAIACKQAPSACLTRSADKAAACSTVFELPDETGISMIESLSAATEHLESRPALSDAERQPCEVWTRVMGYHRPVASFNTGKKGEFLERRHFEEDAIGRCTREVELFSA
jgi:hypothetical protein